MEDTMPRYTTARMHLEIAKAYNRAIVHALDARPSIHDGYQDAYDKGRAAGIMEYEREIRRLMRNTQAAG